MFTSLSSPSFITRTGSNVGQRKPFNDEQKLAAKQEMIEKAKRELQSNNLSETEFLMDWCRKFEIDYKTYIRWRDDKKVYQKQHLRIEAALDETFKLTTLRYFDLTSSISDGSSKLIEWFNGADKLLLEGIWRISDIKKIKDPLKDSHKFLEDAWSEFKKLKTKSANMSFDEVIEQNDRVFTLVQDALEIIKDAGLHIHANHVSPVQAVEASENKILMICISAIPRERQDVAPADLYIEPATKKAI
jgi:hypothetical protein